MRHLSFAVTMALAALAPAIAHAEGKHPAYLHALEDLRAARANLERPASVQVKWDEKTAIHEIDEAIREIKEAAIDDGKNLADHPAIDVKLEWKGRLHGALDLVLKAHHDVDGEEDNSYARGLKKRAILHIDATITAIKAGIADAEGGGSGGGGGGGAHPAYLHALTDLREVRGLLARPAKAAVRWDEQVAIKEVDAAIKEIKAAAIDDGKDISEHPAIDVALDYGGRLHRALDLLTKAHADVKEREDNDYARGLKKRAILHIDNAENFVKQGIANAEEPAKHPAYLHALSDLRTARAHLRRPTANVAVKWDENTAIREIDAAIKEIKEAAIEDGKDIDDHPAVDTALDWGGRLNRALELVTSARDDVNQKEDDKFARGLKKRAVHNLDKAINAIRQGIANAHPQ